MNERVTAIKLFEKMSAGSIEFLFLRNSHQLTDEMLSRGKDIDILVNPKDKPAAHQLLRANGFFVDPRFSVRPYLYGVDRFRYYRSLKSNLRIDICFQLTLESTNEQREIVPLEKKFQVAAFSTAVVSGEFHWLKQLAPGLRLLYEVSYAMFNKRGDEEMLQKCFEAYSDLSEVEKSTLKMDLETVFFKFTPVLIQCIERGAASQLFNQYIKFRDY